MSIAKFASGRAGQLAVLAAIAASTVACATTAAASETSLPAAAPLTVAQAPSFAVGTQWEFSHTSALERSQNKSFTQKVASVAGGHTKLVVGNDGSIVMDANTNIERSGQAVYSPNDQTLQFPLSVGKSWSGSYVYTSGSWRTQCDREAKVVAIERVSTPAGDFDAFRIEEKTLWQTSASVGGTGVTRATAWYAPAAGRIVKMDYQDIPIKGPATTTETVLTRYAPAAPSDAQAAN